MALRANVKVISHYFGSFKKKIREPFNSFLLCVRTNEEEEGKKRARTN